MPVVPQEIIAAAQASERKLGVPASVSLAQWALESGWGKSVSGKNNYGGITAKVTGAVFPFKPGTPLEPATLCWTSEVYRGKRVRCQRWFKDFPSVEAYFDAHGKLLATAKVYAPARAKLPDVDAYVDAMGARYATDPNYAATLKAMIRQNRWRRYDLPAAT